MLSGKGMFEPQGTKRENGKVRAGKAKKGAGNSNQGNLSSDIVYLLKVTSFILYSQV